MAQRIKMTDTYNKYEALQFCRIFLELLKQRIKDELRKQREIQKIVAKMDSKQIIEKLADIEPGFNAVIEEDKKEISHILKQKYLEKYQYHKKNKKLQLAYYKSVVVSRWIHHQQFNEYTKQIYPYFNRGACTAIPMSILMAQKNNPLHSLLFENKEAWVNPRELIEHLKRAGYGNCLYETSPENTFQTLITTRNVKKGAFIVIDMDSSVTPHTTTGTSQNANKLTNMHTMIYTKRYPKTHEPLYISFDDNRYCYPLNQEKWKYGFVIDLPKIVYLEYQKQKAM